jgi:isoquinoline 1-oxidoreductase subunit beta
MSKPQQISRRGFLVISATAGAGLMVGFSIFGLTGCGNNPEIAVESFTPNIWLIVRSDESITIRLAKSEMGQGVMTALPMLVAEELEADWTRIRVELPIADPGFGRQMTSASVSVFGSWKKLRQAGALAREMLIAAAAETWGASADGCHAKNGFIIHKATGRTLSFGKLVNKARHLPVPDPEKLSLKVAGNFSLIGTRTQRVDIPSKVNGSAIFGLDVRLPGMLIATVLRCPTFGGRVDHFDSAKAESLSGVRHVLQIEDGVAVVADNYWAAHQGAQAIDVVWDQGPNASLNSDEIYRRFEKATQRPGAVLKDSGNVTRALRESAVKLEAVYQVPYLAHATMEPMNCTAEVLADRCTIWAPTQAQTETQKTGMRLTGLPLEAVHVNTTFLGGGFGRRVEQDFVSEAVEISKAIRKPVKVVWSREDDIKHDFYRPAFFHRIHAGLSQKGALVAWQHRLAGPSIFARWAPAQIENGVDWITVGGAEDLPYDIPNMHVESSIVDVSVPVGIMRGISHGYTNFVNESFIDEVAVAAKRDPLEFRLSMIDKSPRTRDVLERAAEKAGWGKPLENGKFHGLALFRQESPNGNSMFIANIAEVSVDEGANTHVHRVVCVVDCGQVVNPDGVEATMEGGIVFGLTSTLKSEIKIEQGRVKQSNFDDYELLRSGEAPTIEVYIVPSTEQPGGIGEKGAIPISAAVANAVFAATGKRVRRLPISSENLQQA